MRYLTPDFIKAYECAERDERKKMLRTVFDAWDSEYQNLVSCGVSPDTIWDIGNRQIGEKIGTDGADEYN
jgi:hypothetical protein